MRLAMSLGVPRSGFGMVDVLECFAECCDCGVGVGGGVWGRGVFVLCNPRQQVLQFYIQIYGGYIICYGLVWYNLEAVFYLSTILGT